MSSTQELTPVVLQHAGVGTDGDQFSQSTALVPRIDALPVEQREYAMTALIERAGSEFKRAVEAGESADVMASYMDQASAIADLSKRLNLSKDAVLNAQILQRRSEHGLGVAIRAGQDAGTIRVRGEGLGGGAPGVRGGVPRSKSSATEELDRKPSATDFATNAQLYGDSRDGVGNGILALAEVKTEEFEEILTEARAEGNVSRANVARKAKARKESAEPSYSEQQAEKWQTVTDLAEDRLTSAQIAKRVGMTEDGLRAGARKRGITFPADEFVRGTRRINGLEVMERIVASIEGDESALGLVEFEDITPEQASEWLQRLVTPLRAINRMKNRLKEISGE